MTTSDAASAAHPPTEVSVTGETLLITVAGPDRPGVTRRLFVALAAEDLVVVDIEQVVIRGQLVLGVLVAVPDGRATDLSTVQATATAALVGLGLTVSCSAGAADRAPDVRRLLHVTVLGAPLRPAGVAALATEIASRGGNIERIERLAAYPVTAIEFLVAGSDPAELRVALAEAAVREGVDVAVQRAGISRRAKRLVVLDVDSTLIQGEVIEMLAGRAGCTAEVAAITEAAMRGEVDFEDSLRARVAMLRGLEWTSVEDVRQRVMLAPGARTLVRTLKRLGFRVGVVSGGFTVVTDHLVTTLGLDFSSANVLEVEDGRLTGQVIGQVVDRAEKAAALERFAAREGVPLEQTVAVGDGANDLDMLERAGLGIAFNAKPLVRQAADAAVNVPYLDAVLFLLGVTREEIAAADDTGR